MPNLQTRKGEQGFTLVELAIVMIIIGILIGGVLKGQELVNNARVSQAITSLKSVDTAMLTFQDSYGSLPGDLVNAGARLPNCAAAQCNTAIATQGNGVIDGSPIAALATVSAAEGGLAFQQLSAAGLLGNITSSNTVSAQSTLSFDIGGGSNISGLRVGRVAAPATTFNTVATANAATLGGVRGGTYQLLADPTHVGDYTSTAGLSLAPSGAARIDTKLDDGLPNTGNIIAIGAASATACAAGADTAAANNVYNSALTAPLCGLLIRILQ
jgi:prepilin-type N-terminal cleavage/methylation domain-containing protein